MRNIGTESRASDPDRHHVSDPGLNRITLSVAIAPDPLNGTCPPENRRQQITHRQIFDFPVTFRGPDSGAFQKTTKILSACILILMMMMMPPVEPEEVSRLRRRCFSQQSGRH